LAVLSRRGIFVSETSDFADARAWRRVAEPTAAMSRDLAIASAGHRTHLAWTDADGIHVSTLLRSRSPRAGAVEIGMPWTVTVPEGLQPRFPLVAVTDGGGAVDLVWSADRAQLFRATTCTPHDTGYRQPLALPTGCMSGERLRALAACATSEKTAWLTGVTDRGRILAARWDRAYDLHGEWHGLEVPSVGALSVAAVRIKDRAVVIVAGSRGQLLSADLDVAIRARPMWHSVEPPAGAPSGPITAIAAVSGAGDPCLAVAASDTIRLTLLRDHGAWLACSPAIDIPLAQ
jgi:hypothetical protein